ncbi:integral peroxisomal membrane peroxin-domain-containing protein [Aspergillus varians]
MAALEDIPWIASMAPSTHPNDKADSQPPTVAAFSPTTISGSSLTSRQRSSIIVHRKSPLLVATPPAVTRALAYSHPFILPLNTLVGLLTWTTGDSYYSFLFVATFWALVLYGDAIILWAGPILVVVGLILGMYWRRYSPLSTRAFSTKKRKQSAASDGPAQSHESLDEIVESMRTFTTRCNILLEPLVELTDFLSTQRTATSATTRPALTTLFVRILFVTPIWVALTMPPLYIITTRRVIMIAGTIILTYHSRTARVCRVILWRSLTIRRIFAMITGLSFDLDSGKTHIMHSHGHAANIATRRRGDSLGVRFTFIIYENQRRWLGIGWTYSLFPSERAPWTDEHLNPVPSKSDFELPEVQSGNAKWRWVEGSEWHIDGAEDDLSDSKSSDGGGWIYHDNKWNDGRRGLDGWDRYTRRRKWCRDAELVEITPDGKTLDAPSALTQALAQEIETGQNKEHGNPDASTVDSDSVSLAPSTSSTKIRRRRWFGGSKSVSDKNDSTSSAQPISSPNNNSEDLGKITSATSNKSSSLKNVSRPVSIAQSRRLSGLSGSTAGYGSPHGSTVAGSDTLSLREKELSEAQDRLDRWGSRAAGGTEWAEREFGLGDEVNMGLS